MQMNRIDAGFHMAVVVQILLPVPGLHRDLCCCCCFVGFFLVVSFFFFFF